MKRDFVELKIVFFAVPLILFLSLGSFGADYYVDASNGNDNSGTGGSQNPWRSISYALTQVGSGDRSEKIRTYNFPDRRITDHRIGLTLHKLEAVLQGDLEEIITSLMAADRKARLESL